LDLNNTVFREIVNMYLADHKSDVYQKGIVLQNHFVKTLNEVVAAEISLLSPLTRISLRFMPFSIENVSASKKGG
jgi:hypothetical protein